MLYFLLVLVVIACTLLVLIILVQNPKGGGIASGTFGAQATQFLGARQAADFLEKATWYFGIGILVVVFVAHFMMVSSNSGTEAGQKAKVSNVSPDFAPEHTLPGQKAPAAQPGAAPQQQQAQPQPAQPQQAQPQQGGQKPVSGPIQHPKPSKN